jgi:aspartate dehydrogenase
VNQSKSFVRSGLQVQPAPVLKVGIAGAGAIGQMIAAALDRGDVRAELVGLTDIDHAQAEKVAGKLTRATPVLSLDELVSCSDLVVEAARQEALAEIVPKVLDAGKDLMVMSVGGLIGHEEWFRLAEERGRRIYVPSGAIAGLDGLKAACRGRVDLVTLTSRKPVNALRGTKYVVERGIDVDALKTETVIFDGAPEEACKAFPTTSNVAASLRLAVGASVNVRVRVAAVPGGTQNVHEITAQGEFGCLRMVVENVPSASNPRTSALAALSALATLDGLTRSLRVGT